MDRQFVWLVSSRIIRKLFENLLTRVSVMGPQSSGKSTIINHLFRTNFREIDAFRGRSQTTKGIWLAKCADIKPHKFVMDLEGTDGRERGKDNTTLEKLSALFALVVSNIVLVNIIDSQDCFHFRWCHDIGLDLAAYKPLLKTVFQTPLENLEPVLREDIQKIWDIVPKPQAHKETLLSEFFNEMRATNPLPHGNTVDLVQREGWRLDGSQDKKDWRRNAADTNNSHR